MPSFVFVVDVINHSILCVLKPSQHHTQAPESSKQTLAHIILKT